MRSPHMAEWLADTATVEETVIEAGVAVAGLVAETIPEGNYEVNPDGVEEVVADKGYHSNDVAVALAGLAVRTYIAEPERGTRNWNGKAAEKKAVYANRRRVGYPRMAVTRAVSLSVYTNASPSIW